jgi:GT2 family glycosyltransferase/glycosyltransferase involved in cell wall biosynthesis
VHDAVSRLASSARPRRSGVVSVVVVDYRSAEDTIACHRSVLEADWPRDRLEFIVVDNAADSAGASRIRQEIPNATVIEPRRNLGYAGGSNLGVEHSGGEYVALLNPDTRVDASFFRESVAVLERTPDVSCVAAKVLDWEGRTIDFVRPGLSWYGHGFKQSVGHTEHGELDPERDVLFGTGSALVVRSEVFQTVGGFDPSYFMFFEDVDLGWRLWLLGHRVRYVPSAVAYHHHHATMTGIGAWREQFLLERNALFTIYKNYSDESLATFLPGALLLSVRRGVVLGGDDADALDLAKNAPIADERPSAEVSKSMLAATYAIDAFVRALPELSRKRAWLQARRVRSDGYIMGMFGIPFQANINDPVFVQSYKAVLDAFDIEQRVPHRRRILVVTDDALTDSMAGPAIRALKIAEALSVEHEVRLVTTNACNLEHKDIDISHAGKQELVVHERWCDVLVFQGYLLHEHPGLANTAKPVVADLYDPFHLEQLEQTKELSQAERREIVAAATGVLNQQIRRADFMMCASDKQRDFWLGQLAALGRINTVTYDEDETLHSLLAIVPFGVSEKAPVHTRRTVKGVLTNIADTDELILWGGGIYDWLDPLTLIKAMGVLAARRPTAKLLFLGVKHPNPHVPVMRMATRAQELSDELGLTDRRVFFNNEWIRYNDRQNYLIEADIGVSTHLDHIETAYSFRTRMLDYLWAGLPIVCTSGDSLSQLVRDRDLGAVVAPGDVEGLAEALGQLLEDRPRLAEIKQHVLETAEDYRWSRVLEPLLEFCRSPRRAPDLLDDATVGTFAKIIATSQPDWRGIRADLMLLRQYFKEGGPGLVASRTMSRIRRVARSRASQ